MPLGDDTHTITACRHAEPPPTQTITGLFLLEPCRKRQSQSDVRRTHVGIQALTVCVSIHHSHFAHIPLTFLPLLSTTPIIVLSPSHLAACLHAHISPRRLHCPLQNVLAHLLTSRPHFRSTRNLLFFLTLTNSTAANRTYWRQRTHRRPTACSLNTARRSTPTDLNDKRRPATLGSRNTTAMRRQTPIAHLLYAYLFPHPTPNDPPSFSAHLARNLVPEVRIEVATFYGDLNSVEARYPGLNYCYPPHRMRLGRFKHHKRLFDAFDNLGLTYNEIQEFCCWEGTKWARERYEKDEGIKVEDTTGDEIKPYVDRRELRAEDERRRQSIHRQTEISVIVEEADGALSSHPAEDDEEMSDADSEAEEDGADTETVHETPLEAAAAEQHIAELSRRRDQAVTQRIIAAWEQGQSLPPEIEQYLKEQSERGTLRSGLNLRALFDTSRLAHGYALLPEPAGSATGAAAASALGARAAA